MEEEVKKSDENLAGTITKLAVTSKDADNILKKARIPFLVPCLLSLFFCFLTLLPASCVPSPVSCPYILSPVPISCLQSLSPVSCPYLLSPVPVSCLLSLISCLLSSVSFILSPFSCILSLVSSLLSMSSILCPVPCLLSLFSWKMTGRYIPISLEHLNNFHQFLSVEFRKFNNYLWKLSQIQVLGFRLNIYFSLIRTSLTTRSSN